MAVRLLLLSILVVGLGVGAVLISSQAAQKTTSFPSKAAESPVNLLPANAGFEDWAMVDGRVTVPNGWTVTSGAVERTDDRIEGSYAVKMTSGMPGVRQVSLNSAIPPVLPFGTLTPGTYILSVWQKYTAATNSTNSNTQPPEGRLSARTVFSTSGPNAKVSFIPTSTWTKVSTPPFKVGKMNANYGGEAYLWARLPNRGDAIFFDNVTLEKVQ